MEVILEIRVRLRHTEMMSSGYDKNGSKDFDAMLF